MGSDFSRNNPSYTRPLTENLILIHPTRVAHASARQDAAAVEQRYDQKESGWYRNDPDLTRPELMIVLNKGEMIVEGNRNFVKKNQSFNTDLFYDSLFLTHLIERQLFIWKYSFIENILKKWTWKHRQ